MKEYQNYITGDEVMRLSAEKLQEVSKSLNVYARMFPEAKLKLMEALKAAGEVVAMTGDGVNDGPALKSAHIGIAMGNRGTEIAKEAADLILTDDNLDRITNAIKQGRKIYNNFKKAIRYIISIHIPIILTASLPLLLGWKYPNIFMPIHIVFLELIMGPTCSVFFEREPIENNIMLRAPRSPHQKIFSLKELLISIIQGLTIAGGLLIFYHFLMEKGLPVRYVRTAVFITLILSNIFLTLVNRSFEEALNRTIRYKNPFVVYVLLISAVFLLSLSFIVPFQKIFQLTVLSPADYLSCLFISLVCTGWFEVYKIWRNRVKSVDNHRTDFFPAG